MAYLLDQTEPVLVLTGYVVTTATSDDTVTTKLQFSEKSAAFGVPMNSVVTLSS